MTDDEIDRLWRQSLDASNKSGEDYRKYRFKSGPRARFRFARAAIEADRARRRPLTDDQIDARRYRWLASQALVLYDGEEFDHRWWLPLVKGPDFDAAIDRAIERAHGIVSKIDDQTP